MRVKVRMDRSRYRRAVMLVVALPLAITPVVASAQGVVAGGRAGRVDTVIVLRATEARLSRVRMELDSLVDRLVDDDLSASERRTVTDRMRTLMVSLQQLSRESAERAMATGTMSRALGETMRARVGGAGGGAGAGGASPRALIEIQRGENGFFTTRVDSPFRGWIG